MHSLSLGAFPTPTDAIHGYETNSVEGTLAETVVSPPDNRSQAFHRMRSGESLYGQTRASLDELKTLLETHRGDDPKSVPIDTIFELYDILPVPRVCYLTHKELHTLLVILGRQNDGLNSVATRYMNLIRDMQDNDTPVLLPEWTRLIDTIGKGFKFPEDVRTGVVTKVLAEMGESGLKPDIVLFTSLLSIAVRQHDTHLIQTILDKMRNANVKHNLMTWTECIKFAGNQGNVNMIHMIFEEFAKTKMIVDIVFINELLEAFFNASQPHIAELIYLRLRGFAETCFEKGAYPPVRSKIQVRAERRYIMGDEDIRIQRQREIQVELRQRRIDPTVLRHADGSPTRLYKKILLSVGVKTTPYNTMLVPNRSTIKQFISYHCHYTGRMRDVSFYLNDMDRFGVPANYGTYVDILHAFFMWHRSNKDWNAERLENVFSIIRKGAMDGNPPFPITYVLVLTAIRAYGQVLGGREAREVWELLRPWLRINENAMAWEKNMFDQLEQVVLKFEEGLPLGRAMSGGDSRWKVRDWRKNQTRPLMFVYPSDSE
jgi:Pentatricopeptide repeat domain